MDILKNGAVCVAIMAGFVASSAQAQDNDSHWTVTITPRYQELIFDASGGEGNGNAIDSMPTYGGSVAVRSPDSRFGLMATYLKGHSKGTYTFEEPIFFSGPGPVPADNIYRFNAKRREYGAQFEYTPLQTGATFILGYRHFSAGANEVLTNPLPGNTEVNDFRNRLGTAEIGFRLASALGARSRQSLSAQFTVGIGRGRYRERSDELFNGNRNLVVRNEKASAYSGELAIGYNIFPTDNLSVGARARGYVFYIDADGAQPIFALAPELNASIRF